MDEFRMVRAFPPATIARLLIPLISLIPMFLVLSPGVLPSRESGVVFGLGAMAAIALAIVVRLVRHERMAANTVVRFSSHGVEMEDPYGSCVRMTWPYIEDIEVVECHTPSPRTIAEPDRIHVRTGARQCIGLTGWGEYEVSLHAPDWLVSHLARSPVDPRTGLQRLSIPLGAVDPLWERGPMGDQVRRHRPDLFAPAQEGPNHRLTR
ncbi:hypothetical protein [Nonomuraea sp. NPDC048916]|uniref:hypothetical protein n=1 Tax=Nonomuraea sp. NPDC048916 TaxID=3154232 RepID=UPI0033EB11F4